MKRIDPTVLRETGYIAAFTLLLSVLMEAVFLLVGAWDLTVLFGNLLGALSAVANFFFMGIGVQKALGRDADGAKRVVKLSQSTRYLLLVAVALIGYFVPASMWSRSSCPFCSRVSPSCSVRCSERKINDRVRM